MISTKHMRAHGSDRKRGRVLIDPALRDNLGPDIKGAVQFRDFAPRAEVCTRPTWFERHESWLSLGQGGYMRPRIEE